MSKQKLITLSAMLIATGAALALALSTSFGWFSSRLVTQKFPFTTARLASIVTLEKGVDFDYDGYLNLDASNKEMFDNEVKIQDPNNQQKLLPAMRLENMLPSQVHTFRLTVINNGTVNSNVVIQFASSSNNPADLKLLNLLVARPIYIDANGHVHRGEDTYLGAMTADDEISTLFTAVFLSDDKYGDIPLPDAQSATEYTTVKIDGTPREFFFQIEMLTFEQAKTYIEDLTYTQYMDYAKAAIDYNNGNIYLSVLLEAEDLGANQETNATTTEASPDNPETP